MAQFDFINVASMVRKILASGQVAATTATTLYTVPASKEAKISSFALTNTSSSTVTVSVSVVPSGGSVDGTHLVLASYSLAAYDTISHEDVLSALKGVYLDTGAFLAVTVGTANAVDYLVTGQESA